jgi:hypothetical protein
MIELDVPVPAEADQAQIEAAISSVCAAAGLRSTLQGTLARYPGSVHWHFARPRERGTLEITWWPRPRRLWFKISAGRTAPWLTVLLPTLQPALGAALDAPPGRHPASVER